MAVVPDHYQVSAFFGHQQAMQVIQGLVVGASVTGSSGNSVEAGVNEVGFGEGSVGAGVIGFGEGSVGGAGVIGFGEGSPELGSEASEPVA